MRRLYLALLRLYPAKYRWVFGSEMLAVFEQAHAEPRSAAFGLRECCGLLQGAAAEHAARWKRRDTYLHHCGVPDAVDREVSELIRSMKPIIGHYCFADLRISLNDQWITRKMDQIVLGLRRLFRRRPEPPDPYAYVRVPLKKKPGGRGSSIALDEPRRRWPNWY